MHPGPAGASPELDTQPAVPPQDPGRPADDQHRPAERRRYGLPPRAEARRIRWEYATAFTLIHAAALLAFWPWMFSWIGFWSFVIGVCVFGQLGIPICYHRQLTHKSFRTPKWLERTFVTLALCSAQETPATWVAWHRWHHLRSDEHDDAHSPLVSFFWSHVGWLTVRNNQLMGPGFYQKYARDILADPYYYFLFRNPYSMLWIYAAHALLLVGTAYLAGVLWFPQQATQLAMSVLVWGVLVRTVYVWHITWSVNSLAHIWGYRNYATSDESRNNWFVALITGGEGWHNNHHADQAAASVQHRWWEFDPNYYVILALQACGLASHVIKVAPERRRDADH